jgi:TorA maturation chaperone TorD
MNNLAASGDPNGFNNGFNDVSEDFQVYGLALKVLATAFYLPPAEPFLTGLSAEELLADWPLAPDDPDTAYGLQLLRTLFGNAQVAALLPALREDHTALFIGLTQVAAPPWESVYLSRDHLIFDQQTLEVREFYARFGLQIPRIDREPDDHIGYELLFLAHLMGQAARALDAGDVEAAARLVGAAHTFFVEHPQQWVAFFIERLAQRARTDYYRGLAYLLKGSVKALPTLFHDYLASIEEARV